MYTVQEICTGKTKFRARCSVDTIALYTEEGEAPPLRAGAELEGGIFNEQQTTFM